jgi:hypothetical protein
MRDSSLLPSAGAARSTPELVRGQRLAAAALARIVMRPVHRQGTEPNMRTLRFRLDGEPERVGTLLALTRGLDGVDRVEEVADEEPHMDEDSSSAGLNAETAGSDFHDVEMHALDPQSADQARGEVQRLARRLGGAVEFVERF